MDRMPKAAEDRLYKSVEQVIGLVNSGQPPTDALRKVAADNAHTAEEVRRIGEAFNVSRSLWHMKQASGAEKHAAVSLANADRAVAELFPPKPATPLQMAKTAGLAAYSPLRHVNYIDKLAAAEAMPQPEGMTKEAAAEADNGSIDAVHRSLGLVLPKEFTDYLSQKDGGQMPGGGFIVYSAGKGIHPDETLLAANKGRAANFPLALIGRDAGNEFGYLKGDLPANSAPIYFYDHESGQQVRVADSFADFVKRVSRGGAVRGQPVKQASEMIPAHVQSMLNDREGERIKQASGQAVAELLDGILKTAADLQENFIARPFHKVEQHVVGKYGRSPASDTMLEVLWHASGAEKRAQRRATAGELDMSRYTLVDLMPTPFASVESLVSKALAFQKASAQAQAYEARQPAIKAATVQEGRGGNFFRKLSKISLYGFDWTKNVVGGLKSWDPEGTYNRELGKAMVSLEDPETENRLKQIRVQAMLSDFLANDPVISSYDPSEVADFFNEIANLSPDVVDQPTIMRGMLRRALTQGQIEPFEAGALAGIGKQIADAKAPKRDLIEAMVKDPANLDPDKVIGPSAGKGGVLSQLTGVAMTAAKGIKDKANPMSKGNTPRGNTVADRIRIWEQKQRQGLEEKKFEYEKEYDKKQREIDKKVREGDAKSRAAEMEQQALQKAIESGDRRQIAAIQARIARAGLGQQDEHFERTYGQRDQQFGLTFAQQKARDKEQRSQFERTHEQRGKLHSYDWWQREEKQITPPNATAMPSPYPAPTP
jgi:hypothetical protein